MRLFKTIVFLSSFFALSLIVFPAAAQLQGIDNAGDLNIQDGNDLVGSLTNIVNVFLGLVGVIAVIFIIVGGVFYIMSSGDPGKQERAKSTLMYAIIGLIIVGIAAVIVNFTLEAISSGGG